jgi:RNA polymerase sigma-70 factor, ECF subfamily
MSNSPDEKRNWPEQLTGKDRNKAIGELRIVLRKALGNFQMSIEDKEDVIQVSLMRILDKLKSFKGRSSFTTWAIAIAVNAALSEKRKQHWKNISLEEAASMGLEPEQPDRDTSNPAAGAERTWALGYVETIIQEDLTEKQRTALLAEINGMPLQEIASRMNVSRSAIYKLTFDARKRLLKCLSEKGLTPDDLLTTVG